MSCQLWGGGLSKLWHTKIFPSCPDGDHDGHQQPYRNNYEDISSCVYTSTLQMEVPPNSCNLLRNHTTSHPKRQYSSKTPPSKPQILQIRPNINRSRSGNDEMLWPPIGQPRPRWGVRRRVECTSVCSSHACFAEFLFLPTFCHISEDRILNRAPFLKEHNSTGKFAAKWELSVR